MPNRNEYEKLREMILGRMAANNVTYEQVAKYMGVKSMTTVAKRLKEPENITLGELAGIARGLGLPIEELLAVLPA